MADPSDGTTPYQGWPDALKSVAAKRKSKRGKRHLDDRGRTISLTSLTDMVTMLLVYLLKTFATNPVEVKEPSIELPRSVCLPDDKLAGKGLIPIDGCGPIEDNATIVMVTGPRVTRTIDGVLKVTIVTPRIVLDEKPVADLDATTYRVPDAIKDPASGNYVIVPLRDALKKARALKEMLAQGTGKSFDGKIIILADKQTPYRVLTDVLVTCGESGFADFRFGVIRPEG